MSVCLFLFRLCSSAERRRHPRHHRCRRRRYFVTMQHEKILVVFLNQIHKWGYQEASTDLLVVARLSESSNLNDE